ncbi:MAG: hypothetical protein PHX97_04140 [Dehalococcoidales bacterium]|jgi:hypothetical protein|nr:hypothetical protein [Dehalococcoidales bacterium]
MSKKEAVFYTLATGMLMWSVNNIVVNIPGFAWWLLLAVAVIMIILGSALPEKIFLLISKIKKYIKSME